MIFIADEKGNLLDFNDSATKIFGYSREELLKSSLSVLFYQEEEEKAFLEVSQPLTEHFNRNNRGSI